MKIYLDCCCYNRPFDDQTQEKIRIESEVILTIINMFRQNNCEIVGSSALDIEIEQIKDIAKKEKVKIFYEQTITQKMKITDDILKKMQEMSEEVNIKKFDLLHLLLAENANANVLLTTDDKFEKASSKLNPKVKVLNPIKYFLEIMQND